MSANGQCHNRLREVRRRRGLRQADLAEEVGITRQTILAIEIGRLNPSVTIALKIARALAEPIDYVFYLATGLSAPVQTETVKAHSPEPVAVQESAEPGAVQESAEPAAVRESAEPAAVWDFG